MNHVSGQVSNMTFVELLQITGCFYYSVCFWLEVLMFNPLHSFNLQPCALGEIPSVSDWIGAPALGPNKLCFGIIKPPPLSL